MNKFEKEWLDEYERLKEELAFALKEVRDAVWPNINDGQDIEDVRNCRKQIREHFGIYEENK